jgi:perosamine synthetase
MSEAYAFDADAERTAAAVLDRVAGVLPADGSPYPLHAPRIDGKAWTYVKDCLDTGWVSSAGGWVNRFEAMLAEATGARHAVATVNGTAALHAALLVAGVRPGDEVLVPAFTFVATANAIAYCGATPHFVDCEPDGLGVDPDALEAHLGDIATHDGHVLINQHTRAPIRALVPVHCYGNPANMPALCAVAAYHGLPVVEDAAESLGSSIAGTHNGLFGQAGILSFNGNKTVTTGGGGAILTDDDSTARELRHLTTTARAGDGRELEHDAIGFNYRLPNLNAALGCAQLEGLDQSLVDKRALAVRYKLAFHRIDGVRFVDSPPWGSTNNWLSGIVFDDPVARDLARARLAAAGYETRPFWTPLHRMPMYAGHPRADLHTSERLGACGLTLPSGPALAAAH